MTARSYLYVPGDAPEKLAKAVSRGADALIVDLEDAVPVAGKSAAREAVCGWLAGRPAAGRAGEPEIWVRINAGALGLVDAEAVTGPALTGLCVAKTDHPDDLHAVSEVLAAAEREHRLVHRSVALVPLIESGAGLLAAAGIARVPRVARLQLGEADLAADLGMTPGPEEVELLWARSQVVAAGAAAGIGPPVAPVRVDFRDLDALERSTRALARLGFVGRACIHPAQLPVVNAVFTPDPEEVADARQMLVRYEASLASGVAVFLDEKGRMVDEAIVRTARRIVGMAG